MACAGLQMSRPTGHLSLVDILKQQPASGSLQAEFNSRTKEMDVTDEVARAVLEQIEFSNRVWSLAERLCPWICVSMISLSFVLMFILETCIVAAVFLFVLGVSFLPLSIVISDQTTSKFHWKEQQAREVLNKFEIQGF